MSIRRAGLAVALGLSVAASARAQAIFLSIGPDGVPRYASSQLDPSYMPLEAGRPEAIAAAGHAARALREPSGITAAIHAAARAHGVSPALIRAVMQVESAGNPCAVSRRGAVGLMQVMQGTASRHGLTDRRQLFEPARNIDVGTRELRSLLDLHAGNIALALGAYNAGRQAVARHGRRIPPYAETMLYVPAVLARVAAATDR